MKTWLIGMGLWAALNAVHAQMLDIADAREIDLDGLRGLGPATTRLILREREQSPFASWADLQRRVPGIGNKKAAELSRQGLRVRGQAFAPGN